MLVKSHFLPKEKVVFCRDTDKLRDVLGLLYDSGFRCIPVLDKDNKYLGNIYKVHILEYESASFMDVPVANIMKDKEGFIEQDSSFFQVFFSIKKLPFLAVVNKQRIFMGILPHSMVFELLEDSWGYRNGGYTLTVATSDYDGALVKILKIIGKHTTIQSILSIDNDSKQMRRILVTLPKTINEKTLELVLRDLDIKGFRTVHVESY